MPILLKQLEVIKPPRSVTTILFASFELYKESFAEIIGYSLIFFVFNTIIGIFTANVMPVVDSTAKLSKVQAQEQILQVLPALLGLACLWFLLNCLFHSAMIYRIDNVANRRVDDFFTVLLLAIKKLPMVVLAATLGVMTVFLLGFLPLAISSIILPIMLLTVWPLMMIPCVLLIIALQFFWYVLLLEEVGAYQSLITSYRLVWGDWWRTFIVLLTPVLILAIIFGIIGFLIFSTDFWNVISDPTSSTFKLFQISSKLLSPFITPYFYVLCYLQYHDLKLRKYI